MKTALILALCASMLLTTAAPAAAAQKITNPGNFGKVDGIAADPDIGKHNSYAWCAEMFAQTDADYLWVGTNRDMGRTFLGEAANIGGAAIEAIADLMGTAAGVPAQSPDRMGKIYRQRAADSDAPWELMYENPVVNGYRRMILFQGYLYVCAGLTNPAYDYSMILRFAPDYKAGDEPEIVLWETLPREQDGSLLAKEHFRAACVYEDRLYIGTFDSKIYVTDGTGLTSLTPNAGEKDTGWELFADLKQHPDYPHIAGAPIWPNTNYIWDLIGFNGSLYAVVTGAGFNVFKLTPAEGGGPAVEQIVGGGTGAKYPSGIGLEKLIAASPFLISFDGKDYVYLSTLNNGPMLLGDWCRGHMDSAFLNQYCPPAVFRFDAQDNWELVVGDTAGEYAAKDKAGNPLPRLGNQRAGFFTGGEGQENTSFNQYIWWMAQYGGKLYASTWDMSVFKQYAVIALVTTVLSVLKRGVDELFPALQSSSTDLSAAMRLPITLAEGMASIVRNLFKAIPTTRYPQYLEQNNPGGFDLFVSEDGANFSPVTVNGFGNAENYGGRVLLPTEYGLFVCTANPFGGAQVWRLDGMKQELQANIPATIRLGVGETFKASLRGLALPNGAQVLLEGGGDCARIALKHRSAGTIIDTTSAIKLTGAKYTETQQNEKYPVQMYDVVFTGEVAGEQDMTLCFSWNGVETAKTVKVIVAP